MRPPMGSTLPKGRMGMMDRRRWDRHEPRDFGNEPKEWRTWLLEMVLHIEGQKKSELEIAAALTELRELLDSRIELARKTLNERKAG